MACIRNGNIVPASSMVPSNIKYLQRVDIDNIEEGRRLTYE